MKHKHEQLVRIARFVGVLKETVKLSDVGTKVRFAAECSVFCNVLESLERNIFLTILSTTFNMITTEEQTEMLEQVIGDEENFELLYKNFVSYEEFDDSEEIVDLMLYYLTDFNTRLAVSTAEEAYHQNDDILRVSLATLHEVEKLTNEAKKQVERSKRKRNIIELTTFKTKKESLKYWETILLTLQEVEETVTPFAYLEIE